MIGRFSRATVIAAIDVLEITHVQSRTSALMIELGREVDASVRDESVSVAKRMNDLKRFCDHNGDYATTDGPITDVLVEKAASNLTAWDLTRPENLPTEAVQFLRRLNQDGFLVTGGTILRALPDEVGIDLPEAQSELMMLLDRHGLNTARGHLDQALNAHGRGEWASANGQIRTFFDALLDALAERLDPATKGLSSGQARRAKLAANGFLSRSLHEWNDDGKGYVNGMVKRLHAEGAHPGLSNEEDSTFRLHLVLLTARLFLRRFDRIGEV